MTKRILAAFAAAAALSGCASIIKGGGPQAFRVNSQPPGAEVKVFAVPTGALVAAGTTPFTTMLAKSNGFFQGAKYRVVLEMSGYQAREAVVDTSVNGWYVAGNLVFGGLIGWLIVDPATGAMWSLSEEAIDVPMSPLGAPPTPEKVPASVPTSSLGSPCIGVMELASVPPAARSHMIRLN